jgi:response regulator RpfG family c-di-GMP phosphodiesterase
MQPSSTPELLEVLGRHRVAFIVVGVTAAVLQGAPVVTFDLDVVREHAVIGGRILDAAGMPEVARWVRHHHERIDGRGYPDGLIGDAIPLESRIIAVVEALETITANRYERQGRRASALDEIDAHSRNTRLGPSTSSARSTKRRLTRSCYRTSSFFA